MMKMRHAVKVNALLSLLIVLVITAVFFFNAVLLVLANRYPLAIDLTRNAAYGLDPQSLDLLAGLESPVSIQVLATQSSFDGNPYLIQARNILNQYPRHSGLVTLDYVDYEARPDFAAAYPDLSLAPGNVLVSSGGNTRQLTLNELFNYTYSQTSGTGTAVSSSRAQEAISSAILQVTSGKQRKLALLSGAGTSQAPAFLSLLRDNNYAVDTLNLVSDSLSPYDACVLLAPTVDLSLDSLRKLDAFLYNEGQYGKTLVYAMDAAQPALPNLEAFLAEWGVLAYPGAVYETQQNLTYGMQPFYPLAAYSDEESAARLRDRSIPFLMPRSRAFSLLFQARDNQQTRTLLSFSASSGVRPAQAGSDFDPAKAEIKGPLPALVLATRQVQGATEPLRSLLLVSASAAMLDASSLQNTSLSNSEYLISTLNTLLGGEDKVQITPVSLASRNMGLNSATVSLLGILLCAVIPGLILLSGIGVWLYRRHQ
ncbi:MAG: Gldg family protein [Christensenellales bacterium]